MKCGSLCISSWFDHDMLAMAWMTCICVDMYSGFEFDEIICAFAHALEDLKSPLEVHRTKSLEGVQRMIDDCIHILSTRKFQFDMISIQKCEITRIADAIAVHAAIPGVYQVSDGSFTFPVRMSGMRTWHALTIDMWICHCNEWQWNDSQITLNHHSMWHFAFAGLSYIGSSWVLAMSALRDVWPSDLENVRYPLWNESPSRREMKVSCPLQLVLHHKGFSVIIYA